LELKDIAKQIYSPLTSKSRKILSQLAGTHLADSCQKKFLLVDKRYKSFSILKHLRLREEGKGICASIEEAPAGTRNMSHGAIGVLPLMATV